MPIDMTSISAAYTGLTAVKDIAVGLVNLKTIADVQAKSVELNEKIIAAQNHIFAAQASQSALISKVSELEKEIADIKAWDETKQQYALTTTRGGSFAYALKKERNPTEPAHWICANCYQDCKKSILQSGQIVLRIRHYKCHRCDSEIEADGTPSYV